MNNGPGGDEASSANSDAGKNRAPSSNHDVVFNKGTVGDGELFRSARKTLVEKGHSRTNENVVAEPGARADVDVRHDAHAAPKSDQPFHRRVVEYGAVVSHTNFRADYNVMSRLKKVSDPYVAVDNRAFAQNAIFTDRCRAAVWMVA